MIGIIMHVTFSILTLFRIITHVKVIKLNKQL
jgi:hypothetical protein